MVVNKLRGIVPAVGIRKDINMKQENKINSKKIVFQCGGSVIADTAFHIYSTTGGLLV